MHASAVLGVVIVSVCHMRALGWNERTHCRYLEYSETNTSLWARPFHVKFALKNDPLHRRGSTENRRRSRRAASAIHRRIMLWDMGMPPPQPTRRLGERLELPSWVRVKATAGSTFSGIFWRTQNASFCTYRVVQLKWGQLTFFDGNIWMHR